ncbi:MAG: SUMF1/EgtB/PvdO family nonheme iron enzyme [Vicinamibacterales bacterium]
MSGAAGAPGAATSWRGWLLVLALVAVAAAHLTLVGRARVARPSPDAHAIRPVPGFRQDAWFLPDDPSLGFVRVDAGAFTMGAAPPADPLAFDNERWSPSAGDGTVDVDGFLVGRYEVTVAQFDAFVRDTGYRADARALDAGGAYPVAWVSWTDALAYCRWLDAALRAAPVPPLVADALRDGWRVSLPTEAQWEKASRGTDARRYPWGPDAREGAANLSTNGPIAVGALTCPSCAHGLSDMSGNVREWTSSPYQPYPYDETDDRDTAAADALWVIRGSGFDDPPRHARVTTRTGADPGVRRADIGFRVVLAPPHP